ncbi:hypothetical protein Y032_0029g1997 [Ancylostoma ceylanicum]|uniref:Uncharacterized protein n=1 Tax=Ancylostoma ceylanicum TaxID=53326 RepID=A0A016URF7_9BILA|nr:hypothetical protein Y032_0029g1997 [Ancylostoma ceylanicum]
MEECSSSSDLDYLVEALRQLRNFESDVQRRLFSHSFLTFPKSARVVPVFWVSHVPVCTSEITHGKRVDMSTFALYLALNEMSTFI